MSLEVVLHSVPELCDPLSVAPLERGLTNTNYKVVTAAGAYVVRISNKDSGLLAIDRDSLRRGFGSDGARTKRGNRE